MMNLPAGRQVLNYELKTLRQKFLDKKNKDLIEDTIQHFWRCSFFKPIHPFPPSMHGWLDDWMVGYWDVIAIPYRGKPQLWMMNFELWIKNFTAKIFWQKKQKFDWGCYLSSLSRRIPTCREKVDNPIIHASIHSIIHLCKVLDLTIISLIHFVSPLACHAVVKRSADEGGLVTT